MGRYSLHYGLNSVSPDHYDGWDGLLRGCINDASALSVVAAISLPGVQNLYRFDADCTLAQLHSDLHGLADQATSGDDVWLSFSCHGGQAGTVETLCLFDGELPDHALRRLLAQFKPGVRLLLIVDSCHSGGLDRTDPRRRIRVMPEAIASQLRSRPGVTEARASIAADAMLFAACQDGQTASDGSVNGAWTGALLRAWQDAYGSNTRLRHGEWFDRAARICPGPQIPTLKFMGPGPDGTANDMPGRFIGKA